jgi:hypothetical protein
MQDACRMPCHKTWFISAGHAYAHAEPSVTHDTLSDCFIVNVVRHAIYQDEDAAVRIV